MYAALCALNRGVFVYALGADGTGARYDAVGEQGGLMPYSYHVHGALTLYLC